MLIDGPYDVYMLDRDNTVFPIPSLTFPKRKNMDAHLTATLLDGVCRICCNRCINSCLHSFYFPRCLLYGVMQFPLLQYVYCGVGGN